jgi:DNA-directed RNA polymerase subunit RPC12/RpoP
MPPHDVPPPPPPSPAPKVAFRCEQCGSPLKTAPDNVGSLIDCPKCGGLTVVALQRQTPPPPPIAPPLPRSAKVPVVTTPTGPVGDPDFSNRVQRRIERIVFWATPVVFLATLHSEDVFAILFHYLALMIFVGWGVADILKRVLPPKWALVGLPVAILAAWLWGQFDYSVNTWSQSSDDGVEWLYTDWIRRGEHQPYYRECSYDDEYGLHSIHLGFSESGKEHGPKSHYIFGGFDEKEKLSLELAGFDVGLLSASKKTWHWYGEEISEGEWHLRNR